jgi:hypothetical protein
MITTQALICFPELWVLGAQLLDQIHQPSNHLPFGRIGTVEDALVGRSALCSLAQRSMRLRWWTREDSQIRLTISREVR